MNELLLLLSLLPTLGVCSPSVINFLEQENETTACELCEVVKCNLSFSEFVLWCMF